jgi:hypothetical protein
MGASQPIAAIRADFAKSFMDGAALGRHLSVAVYRQDNPLPVGMAAPELLHREG